MWSSVCLAIVILWLVDRRILRWRLDRLMGMAQWPRKESEERRIKILELTDALRRLWRAVHQEIETGIEGMVGVKDRVDGFLIVGSVSIAMKKAEHTLGISEFTTDGIYALLRRRQESDVRSV